MKIWEAEVILRCRKVDKRHLFIWIQWKQLISVITSVIHPEEEATCCSETFVNIGHTTRCPIPADRKPY
jgi:hypothetical protein